MFEAGLAGAKVSAGRDGRGRGSHPVPAGHGPGDMSDQSPEVVAVYARVDDPAAAYRYSDAATERPVVSRRGGNRRGESFGMPRDSNGAVQRPR